MDSRDRSGYIPTRILNCLSLNLFAPQGNCSQPYPRPNAFDTDVMEHNHLPQKSNQCQLLFSCTSREKYCPWFHFFITDPSRINQDDSKPPADPIWLDNLCIRAMGGGGSSVVTYRDLWMTNMTMQWSNPHTSMWPGPIWAVGDILVEGEILQSISAFLEDGIAGIFRFRSMTLINCATSTS